MLMAAGLKPFKAAIVSLLANTAQATSPVLTSTVAISLALFVFVYWV